jgi:hypothetical protein
MTQRKLTRAVAAFAAIGLVVAACGGDDDTTPATTAAPTTTAATGGGDEGGDNGDAVSLAGVCPSPVVFQTDWHPQAEHGSLYNLIGNDYVLDLDAKTTRGTLVAQGVELDIEVEVRAGGPAIGFQSPRVQMYTDDSIHFGYSNIDNQIQRFEELPLISVMAPLEKNPQIIMWDPDVLPDVNSIADLGEQNVTIRVFAGGGFSDVFVAQGIWSEDQMDRGYDGSPAIFISEALAGNPLAQQGFASSEPYTYEGIPEYAKAPKFELLHDGGYVAYSQTLAMRPPVLEEMRDCLTLLVPIVQQASVDFLASPDRANAIVIDAVTQFDSGWSQDEAKTAFAVATMKELGLMSNGPDNTAGNFELDRIQKVIDDLLAIGGDLGIPADITPEDVVTNEFIDPTIGHSS